MLRGATSADDELLATLKRLRAARERFVDEPVELLPKTWRTWVLDDDGRVQRTRYELGLWFVARDALRAGRLYRPIGRPYADPAGFLMPAERWHTDRHELAVTFGRTLSGEERVSQPAGRTAARAAQPAGRDRRRRWCPARRRAT